MLPRATTRTALVGARLWGQVLGFSGRLKVLQGKGVVSAETTRIAGNALYQARFPITQPQAEASMVRRGSTVRVRQRVCLTREAARTWAVFCCLYRNHRPPPC